MKLIYQLMFSIKRLLANPKALLVKVIVFMVMILILGSVFENDFENTNLESITIAYIQEDEGPLGQATIDALLQNEEIKKYIAFEEHSSFSDAEKLLADDKVDAVLLIPKDYSQRAEEEEYDVSLEIYMTSYAGTNASVIKSCIEGFLVGMNSTISMQEMGIPLEHEYKINPSVEYLSVSGKVPNAMSYYAIAMLLMMLFYGADYGNSSVAEEYFGALGDRMRVAPVGSATRFIGRMLGISLVNFLMGLIVVVLSWLLFGVSWGSNIPLLLLILYVFSLLSTIFGATLCLILGNEQKASGAIQIFALGFTIISGGFYAGDFRIAKYFSFNYYAKSALNSLLFGNGKIEDIWINIAILIGTVLLLSVVCVLCGRKRKAGNL